MLLLSKKDIKEVFSMRDAIEANKLAYILTHEKKCETPLRTVISEAKNDGTFLFMPAYSEELDSAGIKIVNVFPNNIKYSLPTIPSQVLLFSGKTGECEAILDGTYLTQLRTGASSGLAFDVLGIKEAKIGALIGTGSQAECQLEAMLTVRKLEEVRIFSRNFENCEKFVAEMSEKFSSFGTKLIHAESSDSAVSEADLIILVTPSKKPVFDASKLKKGVTISCIGSYQPHMQELDPKVFKLKPKIYFDSEEAVLSESGDILIPLESGELSKDDFSSDIVEVLNGSNKGRENDEEIIIFKSVGIGSQDLTCAKKIFDKASQKQVGLSWE